jgi:hypothetical protein
MELPDEIFCYKYIEFFSVSKFYLYTCSILDVVQKERFCVVKLFSEHVQQISHISESSYLYLEFVTNIFRKYTSDISFCIASLSCF